MLFNSFSFMIFLVVVLVISRMRFPWSVRKGFLLVMSYVFYAAWNPPFVVLLWISTIADWFFAKWMYSSGKTAIRRWCLFGSLFVNLGLLGFFKYSTFLLENVQSMVQAFGFDFVPAAPNIILPVGISFYTFQTLSYTLDVYKKRAKPWHSFLDYSLYVTFFPQLVAGPIVRAVEFLPQCETPKKANSSQLGWGFVLLIVGLFNKVFIADTMMSPVVDAIYQSNAVPGLLVAWAGTLAFAVQIFCDFAGYSTCAIGVALMLGFELPDNFHFPYAALGFSDFWKRWHISLSTWLRDYLYISLGGNRRGRFKTYRNLMLTMLLGGLWHGASWNFVVWGGLHGGYLVIERILRKVVPDCRLWHSRLVKLGFIILTFIAVSFAWVYFRASDFEIANTFCLSMLGCNGIMTGFPDIVSVYPVTRTYFVFACVFLCHILMRNSTLESIAQKTPWPLLALVLSIMVVITILCLFGEDHAFIYFQF